MKKALIVILMLLIPMYIGVLASTIQDDGESKQIKYSITLRSALSGDAESQYVLGKSYRYGEFTTCDIKMGLYWLEKAVAQDHVEAIHELADAFLKRAAGINQEYKALELYRRLADNKIDPKAMISIGRMYQNGWGIPVNKDSAYYWYNKALHLGVIEAEADLESLKKGEVTFVDGQADSGILISSIPQPLCPIAFTIGNSDYSGSYLPNPTNDAKALRKKLRTLGITSTLNLNLTQQEMYKSIDAFAENAAFYDVAIFYYAGHAVQHGGVNYLIPTDFEKQVDHKESIKGCVNVDDIFDCFRSHGVRSAVIILDACRDNSALMGRSRSIGEKGLSPSSLKPLGSFVAYATQSGEIADDGEAGGNSPFMSALLRVLDQPNKQIYDVFEQVKAIVSEETKGRQIPVYVNNLKQNFILNNPILYER